VAAHTPHTRADPPDPSRWGRSPTWARAAGESSRSASWATDPTWDRSRGDSPIVDDSAGLAALDSAPRELDTAGASCGRVPWSRRLVVRGSAGVVGAGLLVAGVLQATGVFAGESPGQATRPVERPTLAVVAAQASIAASTTSRSTLADAMRAADAIRKRALAADRRQRRLERAERRRTEGPATNQVVSAPPHATPVESAPTPVADPWADVSPMERQTTPGPWNNGGATS
jgi:hypothetical protein